MPITLSITNDTPEALLADVKTLFPSVGLPPMQEQPSRDPAPAEPKPRKTRDKKTETASEAAEGDKGESALAAETASFGATSASKAESGEAAPKNADGEKAEVTPIEDVRAKLMKLSSTDGFGHDAVFETLKKYGATNASTVPVDKRGELVKEIDALLAKGPGK